MYAKRFSKNLLNILKEKKLSQSDLAKAISVSKSSVTNWIKGYSEPTLTNICNTTNFLNCTFDELVE